MRKQVNQMIITALLCTTVSITQFSFGHKKRYFTKVGKRRSPECRGILSTSLFAVNGEVAKQKLNSPGIRTYVIGKHNTCRNLRCNDNHSRFLSYDHFKRNNRLIIEKSLWRFSESRRTSPMDRRKNLTDQHCPTTLPKFWRVQLNILNLLAATEIIFNCWNNFN